MNPQHILLGIFIAINVLGFLMMAHDKRKAIRGNGKTRTKEGILFFQAILFGSIGVYAGMLVFRHKTKKWYFQIGIPLLTLQNLATLYVVNELFVLR